MEFYLNCILCVEFFFHFFFQNTCIIIQRHMSYGFYTTENSMSDNHNQVATNFNNSFNNCYRKNSLAFLLQINSCFFLNLNCKI